MPNLSDLLNNSQLWRSARRNLALQQSGLSTGHRDLDRALHSGGWPVAGSTELLCDHSGIGELTLLLPALGKLSQQQPIVWINAPFRPYGPALIQAGLNLDNCLFICALKLSDQLWACEEILRSASCGALLNWTGKQRLSDRDLRRLQLAAREHQGWHIHFRASSLARHSSPAPLRMVLTPDEGQLHINILKQAGGPAGQTLAIEREAALLYRQQPVNQWATPYLQKKGLQKKDLQKKRLRLAHSTLQPVRNRRRELR